MSGALEAVIPGVEIARVHGHANFGDMTPRRVVLDGLLKYAVGYGTGHTQFQILCEHGLLRGVKPGSYKAELSQKGRRYLRAALAGATFKAVGDVIEAGQ